MRGTDAAAPRCAPTVFGLAYAGFIALSTLRGYFHMVELPWYATQFAYAAIIMLAVVWVFYSGRVDRIHLSFNLILVQMLPNLTALMWSMGLWIARREPLSLILRGSSLILYQLLLLTMLIGAGVLFGERSIEWTSFGFIGANSLILLDVMRRNGIGGTISGMFSFLASVGTHDNAISLQLEVQDVTFGIAILLLYYLIDGRGKPRRRFHIIALAFYFLLGFKRILFPAMFLGGGYYLLMRRLSPKRQKQATLAIGLFLIAISLGYVVLIRTGIWFDICERFGIDLMGRKRLYGYLESYYQVSPTYLGLGNGMVSTMLEVLEKTGNRRLHSDVLRLYVELGMPVFLLWCYLTFIYIYRHLAKRYSPRAAGISMAVTILMFVTFLTDNTLEKYCPEIAWNLLPLALAAEDEAQKIAALRETPLLRKERTDIWPKKQGAPPRAVQQPPTANAAAEDPASALQRFRLQRRENRS